MESLKNSRQDASLAEVAGNVLTAEERQRLVKQNKKLGNLLGTGFQSSLLPLLDRTNFDSCLNHNMTQRMRACSPVSDTSTDKLSILQIRRISSAGELSSPIESSDDVEPFRSVGSSYRKPVPPILLPAFPSPRLRMSNLLQGPPSRPDSDQLVAPLNLKPRVRRKSLSIAGVEMIDTERDALLEHLTDLPDSAVRRADAPLVRAHTISGRRDSVARPLPHPPPQPLSRCSSLTSSSQSSHRNNRPLPTPPLPALSSSSSLSSSSEVSIANESARPNLAPLVTYSLTSNNTNATKMLSPIPSESQPGTPDVLHPAAVKVGLSDTHLSYLSYPSTISRPSRDSRPTSKSSSSRKLHRSYSNSSLSTLALIPPPPTPSEARKRKVDKMAKLIRLLGESPPPDLVFGTKKTANSASRKRTQSLELQSPTLLENAAEHEEPAREKSLSSNRRLEKQKERAIEKERAKEREREKERAFEREMERAREKAMEWERELEREKERERFTIDDDEVSECLHSEAHAHVYTSSDIRAFPQSILPKGTLPRQRPSLLRPRPRPAKQGSMAPARRVVSLNVDASLPFITFGAPKKKKTPPRNTPSSYKPAPVTLARAPGNHESTHWLKEVGEDRWEVESYGKVVRTLREL